MGAMVMAMNGGLGICICIYIRIGLRCVRVFVSVTARSDDKIGHLRLGFFSEIDEE